MKIPNIPWIIYHKIIFRRRYYFPIYNPKIEPEVKKLIRKSRGNLFIDIGSNKGYYSQIAKHRFKKVLSIDPNPRHKANLKVAISDKNGYSPFFTGDSIYGAADSLINNPYVQGKVWKNTFSFNVKTITFDELQLNADLVKIDVDGEEFSILKGMNQYLPKALIIELHDERRSSELIQILNLKGYTVEQISYMHFHAYHIL